MTRTFERFLRSFSDEELSAFARERSAVRPPYWKLMRVALRIETDRRGLRRDETPIEPLSVRPVGEEARRGTA
jgi:hypothetical protein